MIEDIIGIIKKESKNIWWSFIVKENLLDVRATFYGRSLDTYVYQHTFQIPEYTLNEWDYKIAFHIMDFFINKFNDEYFKVQHEVL